MQDAGKKIKEKALCIRSPEPPYAQPASRLDAAEALFHCGREVHEKTRVYRFPIPPSARTASMDNIGEKSQDESF
jgi:hypothetical protein